MKKTKTILIILTYLLVSCSANKNTTNASILLGDIILKDLKEKEYAKWYNKNYDAYKLKTKYLDSLIQVPKNYTITIYLGTWCTDSQRQVPRFIKILNAIDFNTSNLQLYGLDRKKTSPNKEELGKNINFVPTIIVYRNTIEVNRIVEIPVESLEQDLLNILTKNTYINVYSD